MFLGLQEEKNGPTYQAIEVKWTDEVRVLGPLDNIIITICGVPTLRSSHCAKGFACTILPNP